MIHRRTEGNPLFMVTVVNDLVTQGVIGEGQVAVQDITVGVPASVRQVIAQQCERLAPDRQRMLEAASVAGSEFFTVAIAAGIGERVEQVETWCEEFVRQGHFLRAQGTETLPEGTLTERYGFLHALYQTALYERLPEGRRIRLHRRMGESLEEQYGSRTGELAAELAMHFEKGQNYQRAVHYLQQAGEKAVQRHAYREAIAHLTKGLELLKVLPDAPERARQELTLRVPLGPALIAIKGFTATEVEQAYTRARVLCQQTGETAQLFPVLRGLWECYLDRGEAQPARELGEQLLSLAQRLQDPALLMGAHIALGHTFAFLGELTSAQAHLEQGLTLYDPQYHHSHISIWIWDLGAICLLRLSHVLWYLGYPDQALK
ncbi:MAG: ATP-binding protein, partial [Candidatus Binatia bacterium]